jgi:hypothetical protein
MGMDYWRDPTIGYGSGGNNHEAGASNCYFPSRRWQDAKFTDRPREGLVQNEYAAKTRVECVVEALLDQMSDKKRML